MSVKVYVRTECKKTKFKIGAGNSNLGNGGVAEIHEAQDALWLQENTAYKRQTQKKKRY